ncbi:MAG: glycosyltransferase family 2 protein [Candidatus Helarchaeota archaeon]
MLIQVDNFSILNINSFRKNTGRFTLSIILPALNEAPAIQKVIDEIKQLTLPNTEILLIDGCSSDGTVQIARKRRIKILIEPKKGYGAAILKGIKNAQGQIIVIMDSDYTYPSYSIPQLIAPILNNRADLVLGNRLRTISSTSMKTSHIVGNKILSLIFNILFKNKIQDTQTGFRAFKKNSFQRLKCRSRGIFLPTEILIQALKFNLIIDEQPITYRPRIGSSKLNPIKDGLVILLKMIIYRFLWSR